MLRHRFLESIDYKIWRSRVTVLEKKCVMHRKQHLNILIFANFEKSFLKYERPLSLNDLAYSR